MEGGANVEAEEHLGVTPLMMAERKGHVKAAEVLITAGANVNTKDVFKVSPLDWAYGGPQIEMIQLLRKYGAN